MKLMLLAVLSVACQATAEAHNVCVRAQFSSGVSFGSGVVVRREAGQLVVLTAGHVVEETQGSGQASGDVAVQFEPSGRWAPAIVAESAWTQATDGAVLLCEDDLSVEPRFMSGSDATHGDRVILWGGAGGWNERVVSGRVTGVTNCDLILATTVRQGDSGGPVIDERGYVVGIVSGYPAGSSGVTVATRVSVLREMVEASARPKPELWVFTSDTCGPCRQFKAHMAGDTGSIRTWTHHRFALRWVDVDTVTGRALMRQHGVTVVPTFMLHDRRQNPKLRGYTSPEPYKRALGKLLQNRQLAEPEPYVALPDPPKPTEEQPPAAEPQPESTPESRGSPGVALGESEPPTAAVQRPQAEENGSSTVGALGWLATNALPLILGGGATGGAGLAAWAGMALIRRLASRRKGGVDAAQQAATPPAHRDPGCPLPKRRLDEAEQLVRLGRLEGRDPLLDATRWMFVEDEINRQPAENQAAFQSLIDAVNRKAEQVAPLEYKPEQQEA